VVFCRGFIYETRFAKGSDKSDPYNMGVFHQPPKGSYQVACKVVNIYIPTLKTKERLAEAPFWCSPIIQKTSEFHY